MVVVGGVFILVGLIFAVLAVMSAYSQSVKAHRSTRQKASIIDFKRGHGIAPVISYSHEGKEYRYASKIFTRPGSFKLEGELDILVDPSKPEKPIIDSFAERWLMTTILGGLGILFLAMGAILTFVVDF